MFLEALSSGFSVTHAANAAGVLRQRVYELRDADERFAAEWAAAFEAGTDVLRDEVRRRAVDGVEEPVFQRGELVGHVRKFSDVLLIFELKRRDPSYRDTVTVDGGKPVTFVLDSLLDRARRERDRRARSRAMVVAPDEGEPS